MSVISLSEVAFKRFEVDSLVDSAQTWHVDTPRASGVWVPANFPQTAISLGISHSVSTRPMSCLDTVRSTKSNGEQCTTSDRRGRHRKRKCSSSACSLQKFATDIHGWTAVYNIGSSASLRAQAQVRLGNPEFGLDAHFAAKQSRIAEGRIKLRISDCKFRIAEGRIKLRISDCKFRIAEGRIKLRISDCKFRIAEIAENLASCLTISIHWTWLTSVWRAGSLDFWTGIQVEIYIRWVVYLSALGYFI